MKISGRFSRKTAKRVPNTPCIYRIRNGRGKPLKIGSSRRCGRRLLEQVRTFPYAKTFEAIHTKTYGKARIMEKAACLRSKPPANKIC